MINDATLGRTCHGAAFSMVIPPPVNRRLYTRMRVPVPRRADRRLNTFVAKVAGTYNSCQERRSRISRKHAGHPRRLDHVSDLAARRCTRPLVAADGFLRAPYSHRPSTQYCRRRYTRHRPPSGQRPRDKSARIRSGRRGGHHRGSSSWRAHRGRGRRPSRRRLDGACRRHRNTTCPPAACGKPRTDPPFCWPCQGEIQQPHKRSQRYFGPTYWDGGFLAWVLIRLGRGKSGAGLCRQPQPSTWPASVSVRLDNAIAHRGLTTLENQGPGRDRKPHRRQVRRRLPRATRSC